MQLFYLYVLKRWKKSASWILLSLGQVSRCALWAIARIVLTYSSFISLRSTHSFAKSASWILLHDCFTSYVLISSDLSSAAQSPLRVSLYAKSASWILLHSGRIFLRCACRQTCPRHFEFHSTQNPHKKADKLPAIQGEYIFIFRVFGY